MVLFIIITTDPVIDKLIFHSQNIPLHQLHVHVQHLSIEDAAQENKH